MKSVLTVFKNQHFCVFCRRSKLTEGLRSLVSQFKHKKGNSGFRAPVSRGAHLVQNKPTLNITQEPVLSSSQKPWQIPVLYSLSPDGMKVTDNRIYLTLISKPRPTLTSQRSRRKPGERQPSSRSPDTARGCHFPSLSAHLLTSPY